MLGVGARATDADGGRGLRACCTCSTAASPTLAGIRITGGDVEQEDEPVGPFGGG